MVSVKRVFYVIVRPSTLMFLQSPTSLKVTHHQLVEGAKLSFKDCFKMEYRMAQACMVRIVSGPATDSKVQVLVFILTTLSYCSKPNDHYQSCVVNCGVRIVSHTGIYTYKLDFVV